MTEGPAVYIGCQMSARGHGRLGAGVILQEALGLRSSEPLGITGDDVMLPEDRAQEVPLSMARKRSVHKRWCLPQMCSASSSVLSFVSMLLAQTSPQLWPPRMPPLEWPKTARFWKLPRQSR